MPTAPRRFPQIKMIIAMRPKFPSILDGNRHCWRLEPVLYTRDKNEELRAWIEFG
jgi:hypothetical protein